MLKILLARAVCSDGEVRLEDKESEYVGRVGLCYKGIWGTVFDEKINDNAAAVVCRQLGLSNHGLFIDIAKSQFKTT